MRRKNRKLFQKQEIIGIIGAGRSVGATHFAVMAAGYISGVLRRRAALLEWNDHGDLERMAYTCLKEAGKGPWRILETDYYGSAGIETLLHCKRSGYGTVLVDYGAVGEGKEKEFLRCDKQFVIGSLCEWQMEEFLRLLKGRKIKEDKYQILMAFGSDESRKNLERRMKIPVKRIPFFPDPLTINEGVLDFFQKLL